MNETEKKRVNELTDAELQAELKAAVQHEKDTQDWWNKVEKLRESDAALIALNKQMTAQEKLQSAVRKKMEAREDEIRSRFHDDRYPQAAKPCNINPAVMDGIKKTFKIKMLTAGIIEELVTKLVKKQVYADKDMETLRTELHELSQETNTLRRSREEREKEIEALTTRPEGRYFLADLEREMAARTIAQSSKRTDLNEAVDNSYARKRALKDYRDSCLWKAETIMDNIDWEAAKKW